MFPLTISNSNLGPVDLSLASVPKAGIVASTGSSVDARVLASAQRTVYNAAAAPTEEHRYPVGDHSEEWLLDGFEESLKAWEREVQKEKERRSKAIKPSVSLPNALANSPLLPPARWVEVKRAFPVALPETIGLFHSKEPSQVLRGQLKARAMLG